MGEVTLLSFCFLLTYSLRNSNFLSSLSSGKVTVGIHVRHAFEGDGTVVYLNFPPPAYFQGVLSYFRSKYGENSVAFVVAGDDQEYLQTAPWITQNEDVQAVLAPSRTPVDDMAVLSLCDNVVLTVGTFGWWAAYLSELRREQGGGGAGDIIYYSDMFNLKVPPNVGSVSVEDHFPTHWLSMDAKGEFVKLPMVE